MVIINRSILYKLGAAQFKLEGVFFRHLYKLRGSFPISGKYISGDGFREMASVCLDHEEQLKKISFDSLSEGTLVYINGWLMPKVMALFSRKAIPFHLITHNSDWGPNAAASDWWDKNSQNGKFWFAQNCQVHQDRIIPIPIGLENRRLHNHGVVGDFDNLRSKYSLGQTKKNNRVFYGFAVANNPNERVPALEVLKLSKVADTFPRLNSRAYRRVLQSYAMVASPNGNGLDTHRTWEAFYLGTIPIVTRSRLTEEWPELPWYVIDSWKEIESLNDKQIESIQKRVPLGAFQSEILDLSYWKMKIKYLIHP